MLFKFLSESEEPQTLDQIMSFVDDNQPIPRSTIRARLSEMRLRGVKIDDEIRKIEHKEKGWVVKK